MVLPPGVKLVVTKTLLKEEKIDRRIFNVAAAEIRSQMKHIIVSNAPRI